MSIDSGSIFPLDPVVILNDAWVSLPEGSPERNTVARAFAQVKGSGREYYHGPSIVPWIFDSRRDPSKCYSCQEPLEDAEAAPQYKCNRFCDSCWEELFILCNRCEHPTPIDDTEEVRDALWCPACVSNYSWVCDGCDGRFSRVDERLHVEGDILCHSCWESSECFTCDNCEGRFYGENYGANGLCQTCDNEVSSRLIQPYDHTRDMTKLGDPKDGIYFGVELEVQCEDDRETSAQHTKDILGEFVVLKEDRSIGGSGYEIVTAPATLEIHKSNWDKFFGNLPKDTYSWKSGECGMHVHVSRRPLSQLTICKIGAFINEHETFTKLVAGRDPSRWGAICKKDKIGDYRFSNDERYRAVNLTNRATIEFRIFRGTLKKESFYKNLEFCHALVYYCRGTGAGIKQLTPKLFSVYVRENRKVYPNLDNWLVERGYLPKMKQQPNKSAVAVTGDV